MGIRLVYENEMQDFEMMIMRKEKKERKNRKQTLRRKIERNFIIASDSQDIREKSDIKEKMMKKKGQTVLATFKV
jgi:hypothetical protein